MNAEHQTPNACQTSLNVSILGINIPFGARLEKYFFQGFLHVLHIKKQANACRQYQFAEALIFNFKKSHSLKRCIHQYFSEYKIVMEKNVT